MSDIAHNSATLDPEDESHYPPASLLIIDDRRENLLALSAVLSPLGHRVVEALSGEEALACAAQEEFAVVLVDVRMPVMNGFETAQRLRMLKNTRRTPVVLLSAAEEDLEYAQQAYAVGAVDYLGKPLKPWLVRAKVSALVSLYRRGVELKRRADIILEKQREADQAVMANQLKDRFIGILGHDLRNPLQAIVTSARLIQKAPSGPHVGPSAERMLRAGNRMNGMISDLLDFTRGQLGDGIPVEPVPADFAGICRSVVDELAAAYPDRPIALETEGDLRGCWDVDRAEQAVGNMVSNALQHGIGPVQVRVTGSPAAITLGVHNAGVPILPNELPFLFEALRTSQPRSGGLGLGLYIVREILRAHGSSIEVTSNATDGTTFTSTWPRNPPEAVKPAHA